MKKLLLLAIVPLLMIGCKKDKGNPTIANTNWQYGSFGSGEWSFIYFLGDGTGHVSEYSSGFNGLVDADADFNWTESYDDRINYLSVTITFTDNNGNLVTREGGMYKDGLELGGISYTKD